MELTVGMLRGFVFYTKINLKKFCHAHKIRFILNTITATLAAYIYMLDPKIFMSIRYRDIIFNEFYSFTAFH